MKPLHAQWITDLSNQLSPFEGKKGNISWMESFRNIDALTKDLAGFSGGSIDPFYDISPFDQGKIDFNITSVVKLCI